MRRVLAECDKAGRRMSPEVVHDLRVALRRCRSMAKSFMELDHSPAWQKARKAGRKLFGRFGELRDAQVMLEWVQKLSPADDPVRQRMVEILTGREHELKASALRALEQFDRNQWKRFAAFLPERTRRVPLDGLVFEHLALERYDEAYELHRRARRNRSRIAYHRLRIGVKRFRYTVENFLPGRHAEWGEDLKRVQDRLGDVHDLDVLWAALRKTGPVFDTAARARWREWIDRERHGRLQDYRKMTGGKNSLWSVWRASLPNGERLESAGLAKLAAWASFRDPRFDEKHHLVERALQLFDALGAARAPGSFGNAQARRIFRAAALLHDVGRADGAKGHHKTSYRMIRALPQPRGWSGDDMELVALLARYHRGAPPRGDHAAFGALPAPARETIRYLVGVLRLALAFGRDRDAPVTRLEVKNTPEAIVIEADGAREDGPLAYQVLRRKWLLELACKRPVIVRFRTAESAADATDLMPEAHPGGVGSHEANE
jgi:CHAD domain-containing protein